MILNREFWDKVFNVTKEENTKIIEALLAGPADILEAQLQPILWYCFREEGITSVVERSYDPNNKLKKLDMVFEYNNEYYLVEIKRNGLDLVQFGKTYTDSIDLFEKDFLKLSNAQLILKGKFNKIHKIFIEIQYFARGSDKYEPHRKRFIELIKKQKSDWANGYFFEFGGNKDMIHISNQGVICLAMRVLIARN